MLAYGQRIEAGPWFSAGEPLDGHAVQTRLAAVRRQQVERTHPYCVYVHVPFCASICRFCALYTRAVPGHAHHVFDEYIDLVTRSLEEHLWNGAPQPPTTVHFGGGTPLHLGIDRFATLIRALRSAFGSSPSCEWAIEATTSSMDSGTLDALGALGFRRVHLGIQTLDDATRFRIGRQETGMRALERIRALANRGFLTSIDLVVGFSGVQLSVIENDLQLLHEAGIRMFSICELRERGPARLGIRDVQEKAQGNYRIWRMVWDFMSEVGLMPIHLGQFARSSADNLYFTHPARGEHCVAIGPYAHGCAGDVYYGNLLLPDYYQAIRGGRSPIAMGVAYGENERLIRALERDLLAHCVPRSTLDRVVDGYGTTFPRILDRWLDQRLLLETPDGLTFIPSADGSWFIGNMIAEARAMRTQRDGMREIRRA